MIKIIFSSVQTLITLWLCSNFFLPEKLFSMDYGGCSKKNLKINLFSLNLQNGQTNSNNSSADKLFECVWPFCGVIT